MSRARKGGRDSLYYYKWLDKALLDLQAARILMTWNGDTCNIAFHCQQAIEKALNLQRITCTYLLPYSMGGMVETLHTQAKVLSTEYTPEGIAVTANCDLALHGRLKDYVRERK